MKPEKLIIHCADTPNGNGHYTEKHIRQWHLERGFSGIGYHYVIRVDGTVAKGRPDDQPGAHTVGENSRSLGVCLIGRDAYTPAQWAALKKLVRDLALPAHGHREFTSLKSCPGFDVQEWLAGGPEPTCKERTWNADDD